MVAVAAVHHWRMSPVETTQAYLQERRPTEARKEGAAAVAAVGHHCCRVQIRREQVAWAVEAVAAVPYRL